MLFRALYTLWALVCLAIPYSSDRPYDQTTRNTHMKAIVCTKYGSPDVLQLQEVAKPAPQDEEVLIQIHAASINSRDWRFMRANPFFIRLVPGGFQQPKNKILGADLAGRVEAG